MENEELKSQLKMYESVKSNYLEKNAPKNELREYQELMDKLSLLKEEASTDSERLARESLENDRKSVALNKYQQMIRNIINANKVAKTKIIARNDLIEEQDTTIDEQQTNISTLENDVTEKRQLIERGEEKIAATSAALAQSQKTLLKSFKAHQISKKSFEEKNRKLKAEAGNKIKELQAANESHVQELKMAFADEKAREKAAFDAEMLKSQDDAAEKARRVAQFQAEAKLKEQEMNGRIAGLQGQLKDTEGHLAKTSGALAKVSGDLAKTTGDLQRTSGELAKAKEEMDLRRNIAKEIKKGFAGAGIKADIDMQTGEVVLDFGKHYFESDSAKLKLEMKDIIEKAMPVYSKSLFGNQKIAPKISAVEIIGFASPTYKGRFVDPHSNKANDRAALKYNMDLSYRRANSIFNYLVEEKGPEFEYKRGLMSLMKVSGRSFLEVMKVSGRTPANASEFCKLNDCKRAQKVIVRFSMDGKK